MLYVEVGEKLKRKPALTQPDDTLGSILMQVCRVFFHQLTII